MKYGLTVFIGRFQPFHDGHLSVVRAALAQSDELLLLCGSTNMARSLKNPFTFAERETMIRAALTEAENARVHLSMLDDYPYDNATWTLNAQISVQICQREVIKSSASQQIALVGHRKDASSFYLDFFPNWHWLAVENYGDISATPIRQAYLRGADIATLTDIPEAIRDYLIRFRQTSAYQWLCAEQETIDAEKRAWQAAPYPPIFTTTDALVQHKDSILLVERGQHPGKGLWALPGGFLEEDEQIFTGCLRELAEETGVIADESVWRQFLSTERIYSAPERSSRGRIITHVFHFHLASEANRPVVQGGDDAARAFWMPLDELQAQQFHDDHFHIIRDLCADTKHRI